MKIREILLDVLIGTHLFEMAFERKRVINQLTNLQSQISLHAIKIILWPDAQEVPHWKGELKAWGDDLADMWLRGRPARPMGFQLAWKHLYLEPFEHVADQALASRLRRIQRDYQYPITMQSSQIMAEYVAFMRSFCAAIGQGQGQLVDAVVDGLGRPATRMESAAVSALDTVQ